MAAGGDNDINLVPYMDILLNLIIFMIFVTQSVGSLHQIPVVAPEESGSGAGGAPEQPKPYLMANLREGKAAVFLTNNPANAMVFDLATERAQLSAQVEELSKTPNIERRVDLVASAATPMSQVIAFMDVVQNKKLGTDGEGPFPAVVFAREAK